jgi:hypothetical protein
MKEADLDRILDESLNEIMPNLTSEQFEYNDELLSGKEFGFLAIFAVMLSQFERKCKKEFTQSIF